jgi:hypothetical protein
MLQEVLGITNRLITFDTKWTAEKILLIQFLVAAGTYLPSRCLATIGYIDRPTDFPLIRHKQHKKIRFQQCFIVACVLVSVIKYLQNRCLAPDKHTD